MKTRSMECKGKNSRLMYLEMTQVKGQKNKRLKNKKNELVVNKNSKKDEKGAVEVKSAKLGKRGGVLKIAKSGKGAKRRKLSKQDMNKLKLEGTPEVQREMDNSTKEINAKNVSVKINTNLKESPITTYDDIMSMDDYEEMEKNKQKGLKRTQIKRKKVWDTPNISERVRRNYKLKIGTDFIIHPKPVEKFVLSRKQDDGQKSVSTQELNSVNIVSDAEPQVLHAVHSRDVYEFDSEADKMSDLDEFTWRPKTFSSHKPHHSIPSYSAVSNVKTKKNKTTLVPNCPLKSTNGNTFESKKEPNVGEAVDNHQFRSQNNVIGIEFSDKADKPVVVSAKLVAKSLMGSQNNTPPNQFGQAQELSSMVLPGSFSYNDLPVYVSIPEPNTPIPIITEITDNIQNAFIYAGIHQHRQNNMMDVDQNQHNMVDLGEYHPYIVEDADNQQNIVNAPLMNDNNGLEPHDEIEFTHRINQLLHSMSECYEVQSDTTKAAKKV